MKIFVERCILACEILQGACSDMDRKIWEEELIARGETLSKVIEFDNLQFLSFVQDCVNLYI